MSEPIAWPSATKCKHLRRIAACPDCGARWDLDELDRLRAENERLRQVTDDQAEAARRKLFELADVVVEKHEMRAALESAMPLPDPPQEAEG